MIGGTGDLRVGMEVVHDAGYGDWVRFRVTNWESANDFEPATASGEVVASSIEMAQGPTGLRTGDFYTAPVGELREA